MGFLKKFFLDENPVNWSVTFASVALSFIAFIYDKDDTVGIHWFLFVLLVSFVLITKIFFFAYSLSKKVNELQKVILELDENVLAPTVIKHVEEPIFYLAAPKSRLFRTGMKITITIIGQVHPDDEDYFCGGIIGNTEFKSPLMKIFPIDLALEAKTRFITLLNENPKRFRIYPGEIVEENDVLARR